MHWSKSVKSTTTPICSEEWCTGVVLAVTSKPICLKSSTQAATGQRLFPTNLDSTLNSLLLLVGIDCNLKLYVAYSEAEQLSGIILCSNRWLCQDSRVNLLEVLEWPTTNVDFWTAFLGGKDGWLQPLKLYATYSGVKQLSGKTPRQCGIVSALVEVLCGYHSQPLCSELLWFTVSNSLQVKVQPDSLAYQAIFFQISTSQYSITVGCRFAWCRIRWFQQSRDSLKGSGSSHVCQVSIGPTRAESILDKLAYL